MNLCTQHSLDRLQVLLATHPPKYHMGQIVMAPDGELSVVTGQLFSAIAAENGGEVWTYTLTSVTTILGNEVLYHEHFGFAPEHLLGSG